MSHAGVAEAGAKTRACPVCGQEMVSRNDAECATCGWMMGLVPVAKTKTSEGTTAVTFLAEPRIRKGRFSILLVTVGGIVAAFAGIGQVSNQPGPAILWLLAGIAGAVIGVAVWKATGFGKWMWGLPPGMRLLVRVVTTIGTVVLWCTLAGILIGLFFDPRDL